MRFLQQGTTVVMLGPLHTTDGLTPDTNATLSTSVVQLSKNHAAFANKAATAASSGGARGNYRVFLTTVDSGTLGPLIIDVYDTSEFMHTQWDFMVITANAWNAMVNQTTALSVLTTGDLDNAASTLTTGDLDDALTAWGKTGFALTTAEHDLVGARADVIDKTGFALTTAEHDLIQSGLATAGSTVGAVILSTAGYDNVADAVWDEIATDHNTTGTFGDDFQDLSTFAAGDTVGAVILTTGGYDNVADAVWDEVTTDHNTTGTFGDDFQGLDTGTTAGVGLSTSELDNGLAVWGKTDFALTTAQHDLISALSGGAVWNEITTDYNTTGTFGDDFQNLSTGGSGLSTAQLDAGLTNWNKTGFSLTTANNDLIASTAEMDAALTNFGKTGYALTTAQHDAIGARADVFTTAEADAALTNWNKTGFALTTANNDLITTNMLTTANLDAVTTGLSTHTANQARDAVFAKGIEVDAASATIDFAESVRLQNAVPAGPSTGGGGTTHSYLSLDGNTTRVKAVVDTDGNRAQPTYILTS